MKFIDELRKLEAEKKISLRPNETGNLLIANYTPTVQFEGSWDDTVAQCRGLIVDLNGNVVKRPFRKFHNIEEHDPKDIPTNESFEVFDKLDGSLGILYRDGYNKIATRGAFYSEQAMKGTNILWQKYEKYIPTFNDDYTYLFEIIYPDNRIVCDYGDDEKLVLLAIIDTESGKDQNIDDFDWPDKVKRFNGISDLNEIRELLENDTDEGVVIKFTSDFRIKVKFAEYCRLHRILTQISSKVIWEHLKDGLPFDDILERVPDEFYDWVKDTKADLESKYLEIYNVVMDDYAEIKKEVAKKSFTKKYPHQILNMFKSDEERVREQIWRMLKPEYEKPFKSDN